MKFILLALVVFLSVSCVLPYMFSVSKAEENYLSKPFRESHFATIDGIVLHYRLFHTQLEKSLGNVLLVHGLGGSTYSFEHMAHSLSAAGYTVVAVDLPGFGYSSRSTSFQHSQKNKALLLWKLLDSMRPSCDMWHVIGHSMGGGTVSTMAALQADRVASVIVIAGAMQNSNRFLSSLLYFPPFSRWTQLYLERTLITAERLGPILETAYGRAPTETEIAAYLVPLQLPGTAQALTSFAKSAKSLPLDAFNTLEIPFGAIWGEHDTVIPLSQAETLAKHISQLSLHVILGAAHIPMETHPEECDALVLSLLQQSVAALSNPK